MKKVKLKLIDIILIAMFTAIVFTTEQALSFIPNIQLTVLLFILYTRLLGFKKTMIIIVLHTLADNLYLGGLNPFIFMPMLIGWSLIPVLLTTVFRQFKGVVSLTIFAFVFGFIYGWVFIPFTMIAMNAKFLPYLIADLPFELLMAISGALSVALLYEPMYRFLSQQPYFYIEEALPMYKNPIKSKPHF